MTDDELGIIPPLDKALSEALFEGGEDSRECNFRQACVNTLHSTLNPIPNSQSIFLTFHLPRLMTSIAGMSGASRESGPG